MPKYIEGSIYIVFVRKFTLPASDKTSHYVRATCIGGNNLDVGYFVDAKGNRFNSSMQSATLESEFILNRDITDVHPFPNLYAQTTGKIMQTNTHPLIDLLNLSGLKLLTTQANYNLFTSLRDALLADNQSVVSDAEENSFQTFAEGSDFSQSEGDLLQQLIKDWAINVTKPLIDALNEYTTDDIGLVAETDDYLYTAKIYIRDTDQMDVYEPELASNIAKYVEPEYVDDIKKLCKDWQHTLAVFMNADEIVEAIKSVHT